MKQQDCLRRFIFEELSVRGEWVRLQKSWQEAKQHQILVNEQVESQLGQALAAVVLLSATIKFQGSMVMQIQGSGDLKALVAQSTHDRKIRGLVRSNSDVQGDCLQAMMGEGRLVLTVESDVGEPYQGIVGLEDKHLADLLKIYFQQSEQLPTHLWLFANADYAAGLFLQELPSEGKSADDWTRLEMLADTVTTDEMLTLDSEELLYRLFHEDQVRLYDLEPVEFSCNCSRAKIGGTLQALGRAELDDILKERQNIEVDCQFCGQQYLFDKIDVENLFLTQSSEDSSLSTRH